MLLFELVPSSTTTNKKQTLSSTPTWFWLVVVVVRVGVFCVLRCCLLCWLLLMGLRLSAFLFHAPFVCVCFCAARQSSFFLLLFLPSTRTDSNMPAGKLYILSLIHI